MKLLIFGPWTTWGLSLKKPGGNKHTLVVGDNFTKWCEAFTTQDQNAQTAANIVLSRLFSSFGPHKFFNLTRSPTSKAISSKVCDLIGIQKTRTTAYHPRGDGKIERQNRALQEILSTFVSEHPDTWDLHIDQAVFAYNTSRHESTGFLCLVE